MPKHIHKQSNNMCRIWAGTSRICQHTLLRQAPGQCVILYESIIVTILIINYKISELMFLYSEFGFSNLKLHHRFVITLSVHSPFINTSIAIRSDVPCTILIVVSPQLIWLKSDHTRKSFNLWISSNLLY